MFDGNGKLIETKSIWSYDNNLFINDWVKNFRKTISSSIATIIGVGSDFQNQRLVRFGEPFMKVPASNHNWQVSQDNLIESSIYFSVRKVIEATWLNDRDQFLYPNDGWKTDKEFQSDCLTFTLFSNNIQSKYGTNHWIPFTEQEVNARDKFESNFMTDFIKGKIKPRQDKVDLFTHVENSTAIGENSPSQRGLGGATKAYLHAQHIPTENLIFSDQYLPYNPNLKQNSRTLRKAGNLSEVLLWKALRADKFLGYSFHRQKPILNYIADFYSKSLGLVIEIDGKSHDSEAAIIYDQERDRQMRAIGITVLRIRDRDVKKDVDNVLRAIEAVIMQLRETPPTPLQEGETTRSLEEESIQKAMKFSPEARAVFDAGRALWKYYHAQPDCNVNASLYDIREHFQGRNEAGKMNNKGSDATYMHLIGDLREKLRQLAEKIEPKVYEYEFLKR